MPSWKHVPESIRSRVPPPPPRDRYDSQDEYEDALGYWQGHVGRSVAFAVGAYREKPKVLLYRVVPHNRGLVFAEPERAHNIARLHTAISESRTWGALRQAVAPADFLEIVQTAFDVQGEPRPNDADEFDGEMIPGWVDGDYPPWLQQELHCLLPRRILDTFGKSLETAINGEYWHIPEGSAGPICNALTDLGFTVTCEQGLPFR